MQYQDRQQSEETPILKDSEVRGQCPLRKTLFGLIILKPNVLRRNYFAQLAHYSLLTLLFVSVEILQSLALTDNMKVPKSDLQSTNATILMVDICVKLAFAPVFGVLSDKFGRQIVLMYGIATASLGFSLMGVCTKVYSEFLLCRILFAQGAIAIVTVPLLADYVKDQSKGKASCLNVIGAACGALLSSSLISIMAKNGTSLDSQYQIIAWVYCGAGLLYCLFLRRGVYFKDDQEIEQNKRSCKRMVDVGLSSAKNNWIFMGYVVNFMSRADSILLTSFLTIWCLDRDGQNNDDAEYQAGVLSGSCYTAVMVSSIVYGIFLEKYSKFMVMAGMFILGAIGSFLFCFVDEPLSGFAFASMIVLGLGMGGLLTAALFLINKYAIVNHRGYISGLANFFSVLGIACISSIGYAVKSYDGLPFLIFGVFNLIGFMLLGYCFFRHKKIVKTEKQQLLDSNVSTENPSLTKIEDLPYLKDLNDEK